MKVSKSHCSLLYNEKYENEFFIEKYVALWAYGYKNGIGYSEGLYRTINELVFTRLGNGNHQILDVGCGIGRTTADLARFYKSSKVIGIDSAPMMIDMAQKLHTLEAQMIFDMSKLGFGELSIPCKKIPNVEFQLTDLNNFCEHNPNVFFDLITAVNLIDRIDNIRHHMQLLYGLLKKNGTLVLSTPLNFLSPDAWKHYGSLNLMRVLVDDIGFITETAFDNIIYKEVLDARGATEEYPMIIMRLIKQAS